MAGSVWSAAAYKMQARKCYNDFCHYLQVKFKIKKKNKKQNKTILFMDMYL